MIKISGQQLEELETSYPGIINTVYCFDGTVLPECSHCLSADTAAVEIGIIGRTIAIAHATTKIKLIPNGPVPHKYYCNTCSAFFDSGVCPNKALLSYR